MNLEQIKNNYAVSQGFENWRNLFLNTSECFESFEYYENEVMILVQKECLKRASEKTAEQYVRPITLNYQEIKDLITNENNIIK